MLDREKAGITVHRIKYKLGTIKIFAFIFKRDIKYYFWPSPLNKSLVILWNEISKTGLQNRSMRKLFGKPVTPLTKELHARIIEHQNLATIFSIKKGVTTLNPSSWATHVVL